MDRKRGVPKAWFTCGPRSYSTHKFIPMCSKPPCR